MTYSTWPPREVSRAQASLDDLVDTITQAVADRNVPPEVVSWLARLLVVRSAGYIEQATKYIVRGYVQEASGGMVRSFAHSHLERSKNPGPNQLLELAGRFDGGLEGELLQFFDAEDERIRRDLSRLVSTRNLIAHGESEGIGHSRALELARTAEEVVDWFIRSFSPHRATWTSAP